ncbi:MAG: hypothetical protein VR68_11880 [Peptococcaceae bacterium BRH_c4a]|nr:MAG: hypothetical protein VR68_11880 [Peptococcaceae bacterium BRH_c4a]
MKEGTGNSEIKMEQFSPNEEYFRGELQEPSPTINDLIAAMVTQEVAAKTMAALELIQSSMVDMGDKMDQGLLKFKEQASDIIGTQISALKVDEVAKAVRDAVSEAKVAANMETLGEIGKRFNVNGTYKEIGNLIELTQRTKEDINSKRQTLRTVRQSLSDAELSVKEAEASLLADIMAETLPGSDKAKFSNDKARQAELMSMKRTDFDYLNATHQYKVVRDQMESLEDEISSLEVELKTLEMHFQTECKTLDSMTAEMNIYAAALGAGGKLPVYQVAVADSTPAKFPQETKNNNKGAW